MLTGRDIFTVRRLGRDSGAMERALQRTFCLVSMAMPGVTMRDWAAVVRHYRTRAVRAAGLMVIEDARGYAHGLFSYSVDRAPSLQALEGWPPMTPPILCLRDVVLASVPGAALEHVLAHSAEERAAALNCRGIRLEFLDNALHPPTAALLERLGYARRSGGVMVKPVEARRELPAGRAPEPAGQQSNLERTES